MKEKEEHSEFMRILSSLTTWNKAKYFRFGFGFQYIKSNDRYAVRLLHSLSFKRKQRASLPEDHFASQLRQELEDNFNIATLKHQKEKPKANHKIKELSLSSEQKMSIEGRGSIEGRVAQNSSIQEASKEQLNFSEADGSIGSKDYNRKWIENSDSRISNSKIPRTTHIEENLLIEEYGYEEEHSDYHMEEEEGPDHDAYLEQEYERAITSSKKYPNKESHQSIQVKSVTKKDSIENPSKKDLSFNEFSSSANEDKSQQNNRLNSKPQGSSSLGNALAEQIQQEHKEDAQPRVPQASNTKPPQVKISKRIAKTHDEDLDEMNINLPPVKVNFSKKNKKQ